jgi:hypothetical protein
MAANPKAPSNHPWSQPSGGGGFERKPPDARKSKLLKGAVITVATVWLVCIIGIVLYALSQPQFDLERDGNMDAPENGS